MKNLNISWRDKILRNRERLSSLFRNYNLLRSKLGRQFLRLRRVKKMRNIEHAQITIFGIPNICDIVIWVYWNTKHATTTCWTYVVNIKKPSETVQNIKCYKLLSRLKIHLQDSRFQNSWGEHASGPLQSLAPTALELLVSMSSYLGLDSPQGIY